MFKSWLQALRRYRGLEWLDKHGAIIDYSHRPYGPVIIRIQRKGLDLKVGGLTFEDALSGAREAMKNAA